MLEFKVSFMWPVDNACLCVNSKVKELMHAGALKVEFDL